MDAWLHVGADRKDLVAVQSSAYANGLALVDQEADQTEEVLSGAPSGEHIRLVASDVSVQRHSPTWSSHGAPSRASPGTLFPGAPSLVVPSQS